MFDQRPPDLSTPGTAFFDFWYRVVYEPTTPLFQITSTIGEQAFRWWSQPRNGTCLAASTGAGASAGTAVGMAGIVGGPAVAVTEPTAMAMGGGAGWLGGMIFCMNSSGGTGGGGGAGPSSGYTDTTNKGASVPNRQTDVTADEFGRNLEANGFTKSAAADGTPVYTKKNTTYTVYRRATSTGGPTVQVKVNGEVVLKLRLK